LGPVRFIASLLAAVSITAQVPSADSTASKRPTRPALPTPPAPKTSTEIFRELLAASPTERDRLLATRSPEARQLIESKLREFEILPPAHRELRLRVAELQYHLSPLLRAVPAERARLLSAAPADLRPLLTHRLEAWVALDEDQRRDLLDNEPSMTWFVRLQTLPATQVTNALARVPAAQRAAVERGYSRWIALPPAERARKTADFQRFFELSESEQDKVLGSISPSERAQMEATLEQFAQLAPEQRARVVRGFQRFQELNATERMQFLQNAVRWQSMTPTERTAWRDLVRRVTQPLPMPPNPQQRRPQLVGTNSPAR
jgi:hypothetical protein